VTTEMITPAIDALSDHPVLLWFASRDDLQRLAPRTRKRLRNVVEAFQKRDEVGDYHVLSLTSLGRRRTRDGGTEPNRPSRKDRHAYIQGPLLDALSGQSIIVLGVHQGGDGSKTGRYTPRFLHITGPVEDALPRLAQTLGGNTYRIDIFLSLDGDQRTQAVAVSAAEQALDEAHAKKTSQTFSASPERKKAVEMHAMDAARAYFEARGYAMKNTSANRPYDFLGDKNGEHLFIEVKGTSSNGEKVFLTRNEVAHARKHPSALFVLANIDVTWSQGKPMPSGGVHRVSHPWHVDDGVLTPMTFEHRPPD